MNAPARSDMPAVPGPAPDAGRSRHDAHVRGWLLPAGCGAVVLAALGALCLGRYPVSPETLLRAALARLGLAAPPAQMPLVSSILFGARLPRVAAAILVGAALSVSGGAFQAVFRNPLVSPGLLGVLAGAGFGAALAFVTGHAGAAVGVFAFGGAVAAVSAGVLIARVFGEGSLLMLVFGGLISTALFTALLSLLKYVADPDQQLPDIVFWLLGSLAAVDPHALAGAAGPVLAGIVLLCLGGRLLDALAMGDDEARTLGVPVAAVRYAVIALATMISALTVSLAGMIGWVGLLVPHLARLLGGPANRILLPLAACLGAVFLLACDALARTLSPEEIPIGIVTELLGVVLFLAVLPRIRRGWS